MRESAQELKVGLFVIGGVILLIILLFKMDVFYLKSGSHLRVLFNYASGLEVGAPVQLAGVPIGTVEEVNIQRDAVGRTRIEVVSRIRGDIPIGREAEVRINSKTLLGLKYLEIIPGPPGDEPVTENDILVGYDPVMLENITRTGDRVIKKLEKSVDALNDLIGDKEFRSKIKGNVSNLSELTGDLKEVTASLKVILRRLRDGEGTLGKLLTDETIYQDVKILIRDIRDHPWKLLRKGDKKKKGFGIF